MNLIGEFLDDGFIIGSKPNQPQRQAAGMEDGLLLILLQWALAYGGYLVNYGFVHGPSECNPQTKDGTPVGIVVDHVCIVLGQVLFQN